MSDTGGTTAADHLCVLVHGLWGNPNHMNNIAKYLRARHPEDKLHILIAKRNSGSFTYDGIELGGERVYFEIEEELESIRRQGGNITKISVVGYSLGGLVARYAVGLLETRGVLDKLEPMTFTTFASPHLGVRTPKHGWFNHLWNVIGGRTLSASGRQLFTIDDFRGTGRPLLSVLADPDSIFMAGLRKFKRRILYTNIVNDRSAVHYTTGITKTDPYTDLAKIQPHYLPGYEDVILDSQNPVTLLANKQPKQPESVTAKTLSFLRDGSSMLAITALIPLAILVYLLNALFQTLRSSVRISRHNKGLAGIGVDALETFRQTMWANEIRSAVEEAYENFGSTQEPSYLTEGDEATKTGPVDGKKSNLTVSEREHSDSGSEFPVLALAPHQFSMISSLDQLGWRKHPVWIHKDRHTHAAVILRRDIERFSEGRVVLNHWASEEFLG